MTGGLCAFLPEDARSTMGGQGFAIRSASANRSTRPIGEGTPWSPRNGGRTADSLEVFMFGESQLLSLDDQLELHRWTAAWYEKVVEAGFIRPAYQPDNETISRLHAYFSAGLSPTEAAQALFGGKH
jgi:hypothetical protein